MVTDLPIPRSESTHHSHTPAVHGHRHSTPEVFTLSPAATHSILNDEPTNYKESHNSPDTVEKQKRKYSARLYRWTQEMWENARQDMERRSSVSSNTITDSTAPSDGTTSAPTHAQNNGKTPSERHPSDDAGGTSALFRPITRGAP